MNRRIHTVRHALLVFVIFLLSIGFAFAADDVTPPVIVHKPVTTAIEGQEIIEAVITDDVAVAEATLHYRKTGDLTFSTVPMYLCAACIDVYKAGIPTSAVTTTDVEYYISATDGTNIATHPATNPDSSPHVIEIIEANQPPKAVVLSEPSETGENSMKLEWSTSPDDDFDKYEIYQSTSSEIYGTLVHSVTDKQITSFTVIELLPDTTYFFTIKVLDTANLSTYSNQVQAKTATPSTLPWMWLTGLVLLLIVTATASFIVRKKIRWVSEK